MTNREKFAKEILDIACSGEKLAMRKADKCLTECVNLNCDDCFFSGTWDCCEAIRKWAESEYIEQLKISKKDRAFLDYIHDVYNFVVRDKGGKLFIYSSRPYKNYDGAWIGWGEKYGLRCFDVKLPMVKREDKEPWKIDDLKKLEVCENYEID